MNIELPQGITFRPMTKRDVKPVLQMIEANDDDDAADAKRDYKLSFEDQFVLEEQKRLLGVTGFEPIEGTDRAYWLGWTFMNPSHGTVKLGVGMINELLGLLRSRNARKLFVQTSDWIDVRMHGPYKFNRDLYDKVGFAEELRHDDYYEPGEAMVGLGLHLQTPNPFDPPVEQDDRAIMITGFDEIEECDGAYFIDWEFVDEGGGGGFSDSIDRIRKKRGRVVFTAAASDATTAAEQFRSAGFSHVGGWLDFHEDGLHDEQFRLDL